MRKPRCPLCTVVAPAVNTDTSNTLVLAGTPDDVHQQLERFEGLFDTLILLSPFFGVNTEETKANHHAMIEAFSRQPSY